MSSKPTIYFISGLVADERVYSRLKLNFEYTFIPWIEHIPKESLSSYAKRMAEVITEDEVIIVGLSFGGIIAQEIAAQQKVKQLILLSSVSAKLQLPVYFRFAGLVHLPEWVPPFIFAQSNPVANWLFSINQSDETQLLNDFIKQSTPAYIAWALQRIFTWNPPSHGSPTIHLHGLKDRVFPSNLIKEFMPLKGGHFSVYTRAIEASKLLNQLIQQIHETS